MDEPGPGVADLVGRWRRSLLRRADGSEDRRSSVDWLQSPSAYADLRQPWPPATIRAGCLRDLSASDVAALAEQEAFAGTLQRHARHFEWHRAIDFRPPAAMRDRGTLRFERGILVETGFEVDYLEHWHRASGSKTPAGALHLTEASNGGSGMLIRVGSCFALVRGRASVLEEGTQLPVLVAEAANLRDRQNLVDCEISMGDAEHWRIERSTLPWRVGAMPAPARHGAVLETADVGVGGEPIRRRWQIEAVSGSFPF